MDIKLLPYAKMIPNILTIGRIVLTVIFLAMLLYYPTAKNKTSFMDTAFVLFVITGVTDLIDGPIARALNVVKQIRQDFRPPRRQGPRLRGIYLSCHYRRTETFRLARRDAENYPLVC